MIERKKFDVIEITQFQFQLEHLNKRWLQRKLLRLSVPLDVFGNNRTVVVWRRFPFHANRLWKRNNRDNERGITVLSHAAHTYVTCFNHFAVVALWQGDTRFLFGGLFSKARFFFSFRKKRRVEKNEKYSCFVSGYVSFVQKEKKKGERESHFKKSELLVSNAKHVTLSFFFFFFSFRRE